MKKIRYVFVALFLSTAMLSACITQAPAPSTQSSKTDGADGGPWPRTVTDAGGHKITLAHPPQRIAILHTNYLEYFFALGTPPIASAGASVGTAQQALDTYETLAPYRGTATVIDLGSSREINLEAVLEAKPDVIVTFAGHGGLDQIYDPLKKIAPVVLLNFSDPWQQQTRDCAKIVGKEALAEKIIEETERVIAATHQIVSAQHQSVAVFRTNGGKAFVGRGNERYYKTFGLTAPAGYSYHYETFSLEAVAQMNPEIIIFQDYHKISQGFVKSQEASSVWRHLPAVQKGNIIYFDDSLNTFGPLAMRLTAEKLKKLFK